MGYPTRRYLPARQKRFSRRIASQGPSFSRRIASQGALKRRELSRRNASQKETPHRGGYSQEEVYSQEGAPHKREHLARRGLLARGSISQEGMATLQKKRRVFSENTLRLSLLFKSRLLLRTLSGPPFIPALLFRPFYSGPVHSAPLSFRAAACGRPTLLAVRAFQALRAVRAPVRTSPERDDPSSSQPSDPSGHSCCRGNA